MPISKLKRKILTAAVLPLLAAGLVGCGAGEPGPFDPRMLGQNDRLASRDARTYPTRKLPTTLESNYLKEEEAPRPSSPPSTGPSMGTEPQVRMTLQEMIHRAVANNSDIKVAAYTPAIDQTRVIEAEARFDPSFFMNAQVQRIDRQVNFNVAGAQGDHQKETDYSTSIGIRQQLESGGSIEFRNQTQISHNKLLNPESAAAQPGTFGHDPSLQNEFVLQLTQPLLRDFGNEINRARIVINRNNQRISLLEFRKQIEETVADIEKTYWDLVRAERIVKIQEDLVNQSLTTVQRLMERRGTDVTRLQISQAEAQLEPRRSQLIGAKSRVADLSDQLKRNMNDPEYPIAGPTLVLPASPALEEAVTFDLKDVTDTALANRLELGEQQLRVDSASTALLVGKNNLLPQLNAAGSISLQGLSGSVAGVLEDQVNKDYVSWSVGLEFEIPIGNRAARATYQRALMQRAQAIDAYSAAVATISTECKVALRDVTTSFDRLVTDRKAIFHAADALAAVDERFRLEASTPELLQLRLQFQDTLAESRRSHAESLANYNQAIAKLEQTKGTLLQYCNVIMQEDMIPFERKWLRK